VRKSSGCTNVEIFLPSHSKSTLIYLVQMATRFWETSVDRRQHRWALSDKGTLYIVTFKGDTRHDARDLQAFDLFSFPDFNLIDLRAAEATIDHQGMTIKLNIANPRIFEDLSTSIGRHKKLLGIEHTGVGGQPIGALVEQLIKGTIFLPLWQFYMFSPEDKKEFKLLGQHYQHFAGSIQQALQVDVNCCLHNTTTFTPNHIAFAGKELHQFISSNLKCLKVFSYTGNITASESTKLALRTHENVTDTARADFEFNLRNFNKYGVYARKGLSHPKYPQSYQMVGNAERRLETLICIPIEHMLPPRDGEQSRVTSQVHVNDQKKSLINTSSAGDAGIMAHNVELYEGEQFLDCGLSEHGFRCHDGTYYGAWIYRHGGDIRPRSWRNGHET
jgi:hypothetical protein